MTAKEKHRQSLKKIRQEKVLAGLYGQPDATFEGREKTAKAKFRKAKK